MIIEYTWHTLRLIAYNHIPSFCWRGHSPLHWAVLVKFYWIKVYLPKKKRIEITPGGVWWDRICGRTLELLNPLSSPLEDRWPRISIRIRVSIYFLSYGTLNFVIKPQDLYKKSFIFGSGSPLIQFPCSFKHVTENSLWLLALRWKSWAMRAMRKVWVWDLESHPWIECISPKYKYHYWIVCYIP